MSNIRPYIVRLLQKTNLNKIAHRIYYRNFHGFNAACKDTVTAVEKCLLKAKEKNISCKGDYYEFGIFKGYTFWRAQKFANKISLSQMRFYGFDSFTGLPEVKGIDKTKYNNFYEGQYECSKAQVMQNLNSKKVDWNRTFLIEGYFNKTLNERTRSKYNMTKIAVALIDCDLYASSVDVLKFISDMMLDGTILIFDDWNAFGEDNKKGEQRAFSEFLALNQEWSTTEFFAYGTYGKVYEMHNNIHAV